MEHPKDVGDRSTLAIILALHARGFTVLLPFGENTRYDLVIDDNVTLARVQCKTGRLVDGSVIFRTSSSYVHHAKPKVPTRTYLGEVDHFAVYCPRLGSVYLIPIEDVCLPSTTPRCAPNSRGTTSSGGFDSPRPTRSDA